MCVVLCESSSGHRSEGGRVPDVGFGRREKGERQKAEKPRIVTAQHRRHTGRRALHRGQQLPGAQGVPELEGKHALWARGGGRSGETAVKLP